jgi:predicted GNAT family acetyltransferase
MPSKKPDNLVDFFQNSPLVGIELDLARDSSPVCEGMQTTMSEDDMPITYSHDPAAVDWSRLKDDLTADDFDNGRTPDELRRSFENSAVVVFAWLGGRVIGKARALSDGVCNAYVVDVWTHSDFRRRGIATHMMGLLADRLPGQHIYLFTDDAEKFYHRLGYRRQGVGMSVVSGQWLNRF